MKLVFFGTPESAATVLKRLATAEGFEVKLVITQPDRPAGRGRKPRPTAVAKTAQALDLPLLKVEDVNAPEVVAQLRATQAEVGVLVAFGQLLKDEVLESFPRGIVNLHYSLLPRWRGAAPIARAILAGDKITGVTLMRVVRKLDCGDIIVQDQLKIGEQETAGELEAALTEKGSRLLIEALPDYVAGRLEPRPQDESRATYAAKIKPEELELDWNRCAEELARQVRALSPKPAARAEVRGVKLRVLRAKAIDRESQEAAPGTLAGCIKQQGPVIQCGAGKLLLLEVIPAGRKRMSGWAFACGQRLQAGA